MINGLWPRLQLDRMLVKPAQRMVIGPNVRVEGSTPRAVVTNLFKLLN